MKKKTVKIIIITSIIIAITASTIAYLSLSQILKISKNNYVSSENAKWDLSFKNLQDGITTTGSTVGTIEVKDTTVYIYDVVIKKLGSKIVYTFDICNDGNLDAKVTVLSRANPEFVGTGEYRLEDEELVKKSYSYELTYSDGTPIKIGDMLKHGEVKTLKLTISYRADSTLPKHEVKINNLGYTILFEQA